MKVDPSILKGHCVFSAFPNCYTEAGPLLRNEATKKEEGSFQVNAEDLEAMGKLDAVACVNGDKVMEELTKGKKTDLFLGVRFSATDEKLLAVECKLRVNGGKELNEYASMFNDICEKYWNAKSVIGDTVPFFGKCYVLFASRVFHQAERVLRSAKLEQRGFSIIKEMTPKMFQESLEY